jgi:hypothetical protein
VKTTTQRRQRLKAQARKTRREVKAQERFTGTHTPKQAAHIAGREAQAEYGPIKRSLRSDLRASRKREGELGQWYGQLASDIGTAAEQGADLYAAQQAELTKRLADAGAADSASSAALANTDARTAALLGGPVDAKGAALRDAAKTALAQQRVTVSAPLAAQGADFLRFQGARKVSARERGIEARQGESARRRKIKEDIRSARKEQGGKKVERLEALREGDRDFSVQKVVAGGKEGYNRAIEKQAALGLRGDKVTAAATLGAASQYAGADRRTAAATERSAKTSAGARKRSARAQENVAATQGENKKNDKGGYSVREAVGILRKGLNGKKVTFSEAVDYLVNRGVDISIAKAAVKKQSGGGGGTTNASPAGR